VLQKTLDFIIIGAQKSGTTTLFKHLVQHPAVYMPPEKEAPFFSWDERYAKGWDWFLREFFGDAPDDRLWGKASPQYMAFPKVPVRLAKQLPHAKLISILRNPIDRAYSHYKMNVRRGIEIRGWEDVVRVQLAKDALAEARQKPEEMACYVVWSEYGRILQHFLEHFPRDQLLVVFTNDLALDPECVMNRICGFLGIEAIMPSDLGKKYHRGGLRQRLPWVRSMVTETPIYMLWRLFPSKTQRRIRFWFNQWNSLPDREPGPVLPSDLCKKLQSHYERDAILLQTILRLRPPWLHRLE
jgi:hypothetical protein